MGFEYQVEMRITAGEAPERLRRIESWCTDWQFGFRVVETMDRTVRIASQDPRYARAFHSHFGGVVVPIDDVDRALDADAGPEDAYDRLAREFMD